MPEGVDVGHWRDFLANRKRKSLPNTPTAHKRLLADLARLSDDEWPPGRLIEHAAAKGWAAIYDPREQDQRNVSGHRNGNRGGGRQPDGFTAALRELQLGGQAGNPDARHG
jgi:hypothetical protein